MSDEADRLADACPTCWHNLRVHDADGCTAPMCGCKQPYVEAGHVGVNPLLVVAVLILFVLVAIWQGWHFH